MSYSYDIIFYFFYIKCFCMAQKSFVELYDLYTMHCIHQSKLYNKKRHNVWRLIHDIVPCLISLVLPYRQSRSVALVYPKSTPTIVAEISEATIPPNSALIPKAANCDFCVGAKAPIPPIWMPIDAMLAKPASM